MCKKFDAEKISFYIWCFFTCSFVGWVYETVWKSVGKGAFVNSGFLHGFYVPIYGFGGLLLIFALKKIMSDDFKVKIGFVNLKPILLFFVIMFLVSALEYLVSVLMELAFNERWWDYSYDKYNLNGRISLRNSSLLAMLGFIFVYIVHPFLKWLCAKINPTVLKAVALIIVVVMGIDTVITLIQQFSK